MPAFITILLMPLTNCIANGIIGGIGLYIALSLYDFLVRLFLVADQNEKNGGEGAESGVSYSYCKPSN